MQPRLAGLLRAALLKRVIVVAIETRSDYWPELALGWLVDLEPSKTMRQRLATVENIPSYSQRNRHEARRILRAMDDQRLCEEPT